MRSLLAVLLCGACAVACGGPPMPLSDQALQILTAFKPIAELRETTMIEDDAVLFVPLASGATYKLEAYVLVSTIVNAPGIRWQFGAPAHVFGRVTVSEILADVGFNAGLDVGSGLAAIQSIVPAANTETHLIFTGTITTMASGMLVFRWAKEVATLGNTLSVLGGSWLTAQRLVQ